MAIHHSGAVARVLPEVGQALVEYDVNTPLELKADTLFPVFPTKRVAGTISVITREALTRAEDVDRAPGSAYPRVGTQTQAITYTCVDKGLEGQLPDEEREDFSTSFEPEFAIARQIKQNMALEREVRVAALLLNATTWTGAALYTDNSAAPWATAGTDIIGQVQAAITKVITTTGVMPNALVCNRANFNYMVDTNTAINAKFPGAATITRQLKINALAQILGISRVIEVGAVRNTAIEGQDAVMSAIWSADYAMVAKIGTTSTDLRTDPAVGRTFRHTAIAGDPNSVTMYRENQTDSDILKIKDRLTEKVIDPYFGHLMKVIA